MVLDLHVRQVYHDIIIGMPWVTQLKAFTHLHDDIVDVYVPRSNDTVLISEAPIAYASPMVSGAETVQKMRK